MGGNLSADEKASDAISSNDTFNSNAKAIEEQANKIIKHLIEEKGVLEVKGEKLDVEGSKGKIRKHLTIIWKKELSKYSDQVLKDESIRLGIEHPKNADKEEYVDQIFQFYEKKYELLKNLATVHEHCNQYREMIIDTYQHINFDNISDENRESLNKRIIQLNKATESYQADHVKIMKKLMSDIGNKELGRLISYYKEETAKNKAGRCCEAFQDLRSLAWYKDENGKFVNPLIQGADKLDDYPEFNDDNLLLEKTSGKGCKGIKRTTFEKAVGVAKKIKKKVSKDKGSKRKSSAKYGKKKEVEKKSKVFKKKPKSNIIPLDTSNDAELPEPKKLPQKLPEESDQSSIESESSEESDQSSIESDQSKE